MSFGRNEEFTRVDVEKLKLIVEAAQKPYISMQEGMLLYSVGRHTFEKLMVDSGARRKIGSRVIVNVKILNQYIEDMFADED